MFKSTKALDCAVFNALVKIRDGESWEAIQQAMTDDEYAAVPKQIVESRYVDGLAYRPALKGGSGYVGIPSLTREGLQFIETFNN
jgi:hypothetical protein